MVLFYYILKADERLALKTFENRERWGISIFRTKLIIMRAQRRYSLDSRLILWLAGVFLKYSFHRVNKPFKTSNSNKVQKTSLWLKC